MNNIIYQFFREEGYNKEESFFLDSLVHEKFRHLFLFALIADKAEKGLFSKEINSDNPISKWFADTLLPLKEEFEVYQGVKTCYLIKKGEYKVRIAVLDLDENDEDFAPFHSPVIADLVDGVIKIA